MSSADPEDVHAKYIAQIPRLMALLVVMTSEHVLAPTCVEKDSPPPTFSFREPGNELRAETGTLCV